MHVFVVFFGPIDATVYLIVADEKLSLLKS